MKLDRLVSILVVLLRKERVQARELAEMFDVSVRTILRDVEAINLAGIPVVTYQGANGGIGIAEGFRLDRSVLTRDEIASVITLLKGVARSIPDKRNEILVEKFKNTLSKSQLDTLNSQLNQVVIDLSPWGENEGLKENMSHIKNAIENKREISFLYMDSEGNKTNRLVEPYSLVLKAQKWYMYGWCCTRQDFRLFKLSRMKDLSVSEKTFNPREVSMEELPWDIEWTKQGKLVSLELVFEKEMETIALEWFGEDAEKCDDGRLMVRAHLPENNWLYGFLLSFGTGLEVLSPPHIRAVLKDIAGGIYKKYSKVT